MCFIGDGANAGLQPASDRGAEEQTDSREGASAQDPTERGQDPHGYVQEESPHHRHSIHHRRAGERADKTGRGAASSG